MTADVDTLTVCCGPVAVDHMVNHLAASGRAWSTLGHLSCLSEAVRSAQLGLSDTETPSCISQDSQYSQYCQRLTGQSEPAVHIFVCTFTAQDTETRLTPPLLHGLSGFRTQWAPNPFTYVPSPPPKETRFYKVLISSPTPCRGGGRSPSMPRGRGESL